MTRAQASIETLILIGGAILVAVTVGLIVKQVGTQIGQTGQNNIQNTP
ncbi:MAG: hypothetical protein Q7R47_04930 [Candidatus Diapherotrites archaeon]|nr:hypothetical protein [Candidatus Diapherotrites archaeon]